MKEVKFILFSVFVFVSSFLVAQNSVSFFEEHVDFRIDSNFFCINGIYSFYNNSNEVVNQKIIFPFDIKAEMIDSIRIIDLNRLKILQYNNLEHAIFFNLDLLPKDTLDINIYYRQKTSIENTYIITTTQLWGNPLEKAFYSLTTPKGIIIDSFSYIPDLINIVDGERFYLWKKFHFSPQIDFKILIDKAN